MTTVFVLAVLWLIVVVPMVVRHGDERRRERSVAGFGRAMRALGRRADTSRVETDVYVPSQQGSAVPPPSPTRRPVPAAQEALMYPVDRTELSEARLQMMKRRRRSLSVLIGGTVLFALLGLIMGGPLWLLTLAFALGLAGYTWFLRGQALRDRDRRSDRQRRAAQRRRPVGVDVTENVSHIEEAPNSVVRIDDDDLDLHNLDTIDLTGLYSEDDRPGPAVIRRAS